MATITANTVAIAQPDLNAAGRYNVARAANDVLGIVADEFDTEAEAVAYAITSAATDYRAHLTNLV